MIFIVSFIVCEVCFSFFLPVFQIITIIPKGFPHDSVVSSRRCSRQYYRNVGDNWKTKISDVRASSDDNMHCQHSLDGLIVNQYDLFSLQA